jgi:hypothetical protein
MWDDTYYDCPVNFTENHLSFDIETLFENCFNMIEELKKQKKL